MFSCNFQKEFPACSYFYTKLLKHGYMHVSCVVSGRRRGMLCVWPVKINVPAHCGLSYARSDTAGWMHTDVFYQKEHFDRRVPSWSPILSFFSSLPPPDPSLLLSLFALPFHASANWFIARFSIITFLNTFVNTGIISCQWFSKSLGGRRAKIKVERLRDAIH